MCISWIDTKIKRTIVFCSEPSGSADIFTGRSWIYRPTANGIFNLPAIIRPFYSRPLFSTFPPSHEGWGWRYDGHSFSMDPLRRTGEMPCSKRRKKRKKKNTGEIPSMPSLSADLWEVIKILRRYHAVGTHGYARRKGWKIAFWNWPDDWMGWRWRGQLKLAMPRGRIVMVVLIDSLIPGFVKVS